MNQINTCMTIVQRLCNLCSLLNFKIPVNRIYNFAINNESICKNASQNNVFSDLNFKILLYKTLEQWVDLKNKNEASVFFVGRYLLYESVVIDCMSNINNQKDKKKTSLESIKFGKWDVDWINQEDKKILVPPKVQWDVSHHSCQIESIIVQSYMNLLMGYFHRKISFISCDFTHDMYRWFEQWTLDRNSSSTKTNESYMKSYLMSIETNNKNYVFFPQCYNGHWVLFVFDILNQSIYCMNPIVSNSFDPKYFSKSLEYKAFNTFVQEFIKKPIEIEEGVQSMCMNTLFEGKLFSRPVSNQKNSIDCGIMVCYYMRCLSLGRENDIGNFEKQWTNGYLFRKHMLMELEEKQLYERLHE